MANTIKIKRGSGSDPAASDMVLGEPVLRTDTAELFFKKDDGSVAKVSGGGGGPDFKYLALRNAANNGAASFPNADFTLVTSGTTSAITPTAANTLLVSVNGVIQKPNTGTSTPSQGFALSGSTIKFGANISAAPDFILYQESGGIGEPSDETVSEEKLKVSNSPVNGYFLSAQSGNTGGLTWAAPVATSCTGNSATATALATARTINGTSFDGTANITVTAAAGTLTGNTLNSSVVTSSLTSLGDLAGLTVDGDMVLTGANYNVLWDKSDNALKFADNTKAIFGTGGDGELYHDGSHTYLKDVGTGNLRLASDSTMVIQKNTGGETIANFIPDGAVELYYDNNKKLETLSNGAKITGTFVPDGDGNRDLGSTSLQWQNVYIDNDLFIGDNGKAIFGDGSDLQIFHSGANSHINHVGTGGLFIDSSGDTYFRNTAGDENRAIFKNNGAVELYYDNSKKFETYSAGCLFTGNLKNTNDGADQAIYLGASDDLGFYHDGSDSYIENATGNLNLRVASGENGIRITPNGSVNLYYNNNQKLNTANGGVEVTGTVTSSSHIISGGMVDISDNNQLRLGNSQDMMISHDGSSSGAIRNQTGELYLRSDGIRLVNNGNDETYIKCVDDGTVELYHDNVLALQTKVNQSNLGAGVILQNPVGAGNRVVDVKHTSGDYAFLAFEDQNTNDNSTVRLGAYGNTMRFYGGGNFAAQIDTNGHFLPGSNNLYDLGSSSYKWRNVYTNDLNLSNEGGSNDVDGTWGSYTIQEGAEDLFLVNKRNGKKYKFNLTEIS